MRTRWLSLTALVLAASACAPRARMCTASSDCAASSACVAGRCQLERGELRPAVDGARRLVVHPEDLAYVRRGERAEVAEAPSVVALGISGARLLLRFAVALPPTAEVVEAYVVLHRADVVDDDPAPVSLHATRIVDAWDGRSTSWALQPRLAEGRTPSTTVAPGGPPLVRVDVRDLVRRWSKHDPADQGIAIVGDVVGGGESRTGTTFALRASGVDRGREEPSTDLRAPMRTFGASPDLEPYLEVYLRGGDLEPGEGRDASSRDAGSRRSDTSFAGPASSGGVNAPSAVPRSGRPPSATSRSKP